MDSPPRPRHHIPSPSSAPKRPQILFPSSSASSSKAAPDSTFHNYTSGLHPINSTNRLSCSQWFSETDFPPQPSVFSLPSMNPQWESNLSTSGSANLYANEAALLGLAGNSNAVIPSTSCKRVDGRLNNGPELPTREVDGVVHCGVFCDNTSATQHPEQIGPQVVGQPQIMHRYLRFEIAGACQRNSLNSWRGENAYANSLLLESLCSSQQRGIFRNQPLVNPATKNSQFPPATITGMAGFTHYAANPNILAPGNFLMSEVSDTTKHSNQISPRKKRNRAKLSIGIQDGKHCRCKKSRCLKLYCKCFADDKHCTDACGCSDCNNNYENDGKLQEVRGQIQSRNPHAFGPKIVNFDTDSRGGDGKWMTPSSSSGRHRRGCNCKKSTCQKKYCECYQAKVGCSDVCRCEGCRNSYGRKADRRVERRRIRSHERLNMGAADHEVFQRYQGIRDINQNSPSFHPHTGAASSTQALANPRQLGFHAPLYDSQFVHQLPENVQAADGMPRQRRVKLRRYSSLPPLRRASDTVSSTQSI